MALSVNTNIGSLNAMAAASRINDDMETAMNRLSTGKRVNTAADDAAGVAIASRLTSEIRGTNQAIRNAQDGQALIDTAEGAHEEIEAILQRMRELAVQASNDTNDSDDRANLQAEFSALATEIDRIAGATTWAGQELLNGTGSGTGSATFALQVGGNTGTVDTISVNIAAMTASALGQGDSVDGSVTTTGVDSVTGVTAVTGVTGVAEVLAFDFTTATIPGQASGDVITLTIDSNTTTYTTQGATESLTTIATGLQAANTNTLYTIGVDTAGTSLTVTYASTGVVTDATTITLADAASTPVSATGTVSTQGVDAVTAVTGVTAVTAVAQKATIDVSDFSVAEGQVYQLDVGSVTLTYTATASDTTIASVLTGMADDDDYDATLFTMAVSGTTVTVTWTTAEAVDADESTVAFAVDQFDISSAGQASAMIDLMDAAISTVNTQRAELGAVSNRLDSTVNNLTNISTNLQAGLGRIVDADFAVESSAMAKAQILQQAATAMLAQANASKQGVLQLLKG